MRPFGDDARRARRQRAVDDAVFGDDAGEIHLGDDLDDRRAADAGDAGRPGRCPRSPASSDHLSTPMTRYFGSSVSGSMRTRSMAPGAARWPDGDFGALEGRAGRRGGRDDARAVAEHDLGIGADIDQQHHLVLAVRAFRQRRAGGIGADMAGDAGQHVEPRAPVDVDVDLVRPDTAARRRRRARTGAWPSSVGSMPRNRWCMIGLPTKTQSKMSLRSTPPSSQTLPISPLTASRTALVMRFAAVRVHHHIGDAAHQILAEADLRVRRAGRGGDAARQQRHQMHGDGGRADVAGDAVGLVLQAGIERDDERARAASMSRWMAAVTPQLPLRRMLLHLRHADAERPAGPSSPSPSSSATFSRSRSPSGLCMSGSSTST